MQYTNGRIETMEIQRSDFIDVPVTRYVSEENAFVADHKYTSEEVFFDIDLNGENFTTAFCSPVDFEDLIVGMLAQMLCVHRHFHDIVKAADASHLCEHPDDEILEVDG